MNVSGFRLIFDTSAINKLHGDELRDVLVTAIQATGELVGTGVNLVEIATTPDFVKRCALLHFLHRLTRGQTPHTLPDHVLGRCARAFHSRSDRVQLQIKDDEPELALLLVEPEAIREGVVERWLEWRRKMERAFVESHRSARPDFQSSIEAGYLSALSFASAVKRYRQNPAFVAEVTNWTYEKATGTRITTAELDRFFRRFPSWHLFLLSWAYAAYRRAIAPERFGEKNNAGAYDLFSAVYLPLCSHLVTDDENQLEGLAEISRYCPNPPEVVSWNTFRKRLAPDL